MLIIRKPLWKMLLLKCQDGMGVGGCRLCNRDRRMKAFIYPWRSSIARQISDEIEAAFCFSPSTRLEERPCSRQVHRHPLPEVGEASTQLDLCCSSSFERGKSVIVEHAPYPLSLVGRGYEQGHEISFQRRYSLANLGRNPADDLRTRHCDEVIFLLIRRMSDRDGVKDVIRKRPEVVQCELPECVHLQRISLWFIWPKLDHTSPFIRNSHLFYHD